MALSNNLVGLLTIFLCIAGSAARCQRRHGQEGHCSGYHGREDCEAHGCVYTSSHSHRKHEDQKSLQADDDDHHHRHHHRHRHVRHGHKKDSKANEDESPEVEDVKPRISNWVVPVAGPEVNFVNKECTQAQFSLKGIPFARFAKLQATVLTQQLLLRGLNNNDNKLWGPFVDPKVIFCSAQDQTTHLLMKQSITLMEAQESDSPELEQKAPLISKALKEKMSIVSQALGESCADFVTKQQSETAFEDSAKVDACKAHLKQKVASNGRKLAWLNIPDFSVVLTAQTSKTGKLNMDLGLMKKTKTFHLTRMQATPSAKLEEFDQDDLKGSASLHLDGGKCQFKSTEKYVTVQVDEDILENGVKKETRSTKLSLYSDKFPKSLHGLFKESISSFTELRDFFKFICTLTY